MKKLYWTLLVILILCIAGYAVTSISGSTISNLGVTTPLVTVDSLEVRDGSSTKINASEINNEYLVYNTTDTSSLNYAISKCDGVNPCYVKVRGNITTGAVTLKSNLYLDFNGAEIHTTTNLFDTDNLTNLVIEGGRFYGNINGRFMGMSNITNFIVRNIEKIDNFNVIAFYNISNFSFVNNKQIKTKWAIQIYGSLYGEILFNEVIDSSSSDIGIGLFGGCHDIIIANNIDYEGISVAGTYDTHPEYAPCYNIKISNNEVRTAQDDCISLWGTYDSEITNNKVIDCVEDGIIIRSQQNVSSRNVKINDNYILNSCQVAIQNGQDNGEVKNNRIYNHCGGLGNSMITSYGGYCDYGCQNTIDGNELINGGVGIEFVYNNTIIKNNRIINSTGWAIRHLGGDNCIFENNLIDSNSYSTYSYGIDINGENATLKGNIIRNTKGTYMQYPIYLRKNNTKVIDNIIDYYSISPIYEYGDLVSNYIDNNYYDNQYHRTTIYNEYLSDENLTIYLPFNKDLKDYSGNNFNAWNASYFTNYVNAKYGSGLNISGDTMHTYQITHDNLFNINSSDSMTIMAWTKKNSNLSSNSYLVSKISEVPYSSSHEAGWLISQTNTGYYYVLSDGTNYDSTFRRIGLTKDYNDWNHFALVFDRNSGYVYGYVNGKLQGSLTHVTFGALNNSRNIVFGKELGRTSRNYTGIIDEFKFYKRALSSDEIMSAYQLKSEFYGRKPFLNINGGGIIYGTLTVNQTVTIGDGTLQRNITLTSPDASEWCCGVDNSGTYSCSSGSCQ